MKKRSLLLTIFLIGILLILSGVGSVSYAYSNKRYLATCTTGGTTGCLDKINGSLLNSGDIAITITATNSYTHTLKISGCGAESAPITIIPDSNPGTKCWIQVPATDIPVTIGTDGQILISDGSDASWISISGDIGITNAGVVSVTVNAINDTHMDWGTGANQVSAVDVPIADGGGLITGTEVETALQENRGLVDTITAAVANHTDTSATGTELNTLTDTSDASGLHNHTTANLNDTTATGANLNTLTDDSMADALHRHSGLSASDGTPDNNFAFDADGNATLLGGFEVTGNVIITADITDPALGEGIIFNITNPVSDNAGKYGFHQTTTNEDTTTLLLIGQRNQLFTGHIDHDHASDDFISERNLLIIDGNDGTTITDAKVSNNKFQWGQTVATEDVTVTNGIGVMATIVNASDVESVLTLTNYDGFLTRINMPGSVDSDISGTSWTGFHHVDLTTGIRGGTLAEQIGFEVDDLNGTKTAAIAIWGDDPIVWNNIDGPNITGDVLGLDVNLTKSDNADESTIALSVNFINNDTDLNNSIGLQVDYTLGDVDRGAGNDSIVGNQSRVIIQTDTGDTIGAIKTYSGQIRYAPQEAGDIATLTQAEGIKHTLRAAGVDNTNVMTLPLYDAFVSDMSETGSVSEISTTTGTWTHFRAKDLNFTTGNGPKYLIGLAIEDQTGASQSGAINAGIVLDDGADCVWMDGLSGTAICSETVTLTATQIRAMTTPINVVAARAGAWIEVVSVVFFYDYAVAAFDDAAADGNILLEYEGGTDIMTAFDADGFIDEANDEGRYLAQGGVSYPAITDDIMAVDGEGIDILNDGAAFTGATAEGELDIKITYKVHVL